VSFDHDRMAALRERFVAAAGGQASELAALLQADDFEGARQLAHGLAGRSGMFGFAELGECARRVDEAGPQAVRRHAEELLAALRRLAQEG